mmetsp:Transcript_22477/g.77003  ORF Transcript_22477/g.77003 Transcript_22477/m.77003 type:complete len:769 (+) Transcript_22477:362-2668(+)
MQQAVIVLPMHGLPALCLDLRQDLRLLRRQALQTRPRRRRFRLEGESRRRRPRRQRQGLRRRGGRGGGQGAEGQSGGRCRARGQGRGEGRRRQRRGALRSQVVRQPLPLELLGVGQRGAAEVIPGVEHLRTTLLSSDEFDDVPPAFLRRPMQRRSTTRPVSGGAHALAGQTDQRVDDRFGYLHQGAVAPQQIQLLLTPLDLQDQVLLDLLELLWSQLLPRLRLLPQSPEGVQGGLHTRAGRPSFQVQVVFAFPFSEAVGECAAGPSNLRGMLDQVGNHAHVHPARIRDGRVGTPARIPDLLHKGILEARQEVGQPGGRWSRVGSPTRGARSSGRFAPERLPNGTAIGRSPGVAAPQHLDLTILFLELKPQVGFQSVVRLVYGSGILQHPSVVLVRLAFAPLQLNNPRCTVSAVLLQFELQLPHLSPQQRFRGLPLQLRFPEFLQIRLRQLQYPKALAGGFELGPQAAVLTSQILEIASVFVFLAKDVLVSAMKVVVLPPALLTGGLHTELAMLPEAREILLRNRVLLCQLCAIPVCGVQGRPVAGGLHGRPLELLLQRLVAPLQLLPPPVGQVPLPLKRRMFGLSIPENLSPLGVPATLGLTPGALQGLLVALGELLAQVLPSLEHRVLQLSLVICLQFRLGCSALQLHTLHVPLQGLLLHLVSLQRSFVLLPKLQQRAQGAPVLRLPVLVHLLGGAVLVPELRQAVQGRGMLGLPVLHGRLVLGQLLVDLAVVQFDLISSPVRVVPRPLQVLERELVLPRQPSLRIL